MKLTVAKKERRIYRVLLILMIFSLLVTGCGQNADTNPDNDGKDPNASIGESPDNGNVETDTNEGTNPDNGNGETNTNEDINPDNGNGKTDTSVGAALEYGFVPSDSCEEQPIFRCAYRSNKTEFDIDNVTVDFYYGGYYPLGAEYYLQIENFPTFEIYFTTDNLNTICFVKRVEENLVSEKYRYNYICDDNWNATEIRFNHSESITIPREIFTKNEGVIYFTIYSQNVNYTNSSVKAIAGTPIHYRIIGEKVVLSHQPILPFS